MGEQDLYQTGEGRDHPMKDPHKEYIKEKEGDGKGKDWMPSITGTWGAGEQSKGGAIA